MKKIRLLVAAPVLAVALTLTLTSCQQLDVIDNTSITSYGEVVKALPNNIKSDEAGDGWLLTAPDNSAVMYMSKDFSKSKDDVQLIFPAKPFLNAGLDPSKLPEGMVSGDNLTVGTDLGDKAFTYNGQVTPAATFEQLIRNKRDALGYHAVLDHFGIGIGDGNAFEFAKNMKKNDKDIVFVLNPKPFIDAGVNPSKLEGWVYAKVETMDKSGKTVKVDKLLKPFNIQK